MSTAVCTRVARYLSDQPLFIEPHALKIMLDAIGPRLGLLEIKASDDDDGESPAATKRKALTERLAAVVGAETVDVADGMCEYGRTPEGIAVVPILGSTINRYDWFAAWCGFSSYETIKLAVQAADADPLVKAILLDVDSPGGEAAGMLDCADVIRAVGKPIWASANTLAASAGYGLAAAAKRLTLGRLSTVGSVGVVGIHVDQSGRDQELGLKYTPIYSGARKIDGWGHAALSREVKERFQARFDESRLKFATAIAQFRGMSVEAVMETEAETFDDARAVDIGFADAVQSFDETLAELTAEVTSTGLGSGAGTWRFALIPSMEVSMKDKTAAAPAGAKAETETPTTPAATAPANTLAPKTEDPAKDEPEAGKQEKKEGEGEEGKDDGKKAADPAEIAEYCNANGAPQLIAGLIRDKATMDDVKAKVGSASKIREMAKAARATGCTIDSGFEDTAIERGMTLEEVRAALFDKLTAQQSPEIRGQSSASDIAGQTAGNHGWDKAFASTGRAVRA
jgi:ClpP class serine protease